MKWSFVAFLVSAFASSAASAHWQYTKWGMQPAEVVAASEGKVRLSPGRPEQKEDGLEVGGEGAHAVGSSGLPVTFYFNAGGLELVKLTAEGDGVCYALNHRLAGEYGTPFAMDSNPVLLRKTWKDQDRGNQLEYLRIGDTCWLKYRPLSLIPKSEL